MGFWNSVFANLEHLRHTFLFPFWKTEIYCHFTVSRFKHAPVWYISAARDWKRKLKLITLGSERKCLVNGIGHGTVRLGTVQEVIFFWIENLKHLLTNWTGRIKKNHKKKIFLVSYAAPKFTKFFMIWDPQNTKIYFLLCIGRLPEVSVLTFSATDLVCQYCTQKYSFICSAVG